MTTEANPTGIELARLDRIFKQQQQQQAFANDPMPALEERKLHLKTLKTLLLQHRDEIAQAISADFTARSPNETLLVEIMPCISLIDYVLKRLSRWMKPSSHHIGLQFLPARAKVVYQPLGVVGIMVPSGLYRTGFATPFQKD